MAHPARLFWYRCLNEPSTEFFPSIFVTAFLSVAIILNILAVVLGSMPEFSGQSYRELTLIFSIVFAIIFGSEYLMRCWVAADTPHEKEISDLKKRWAYLKSPMGLIDLFSFLPLVFLLFAPSETYGDLRVLKLISMVRVLKLTRYSASLLMLARVYRENKNTLFAAMLVMMILVFIAATGIYIFEKNVQPNAFGSIPACMWWAVVTLTTVGYGDITPITMGGKLFGTLVMVCGVGIAAMPAGIFASSFVQLIREQEHERRIKRRKQRAKGIADKAAAIEKVSETLHLELSPSEQREVAYLVSEYSLTLDQATGVVMHFRH